MEVALVQYITFLKISTIILQNSLKLAISSKMPLQNNICCRKWDDIYTEGALRNN